MNLPATSPQTLVLLIIALTSSALVEEWIVWRERQTPQPASREDEGSLPYLQLAGFVAIIGALAATWVPFTEIAPRAISALLAFVLILVGTGLRLWAALTLGRFFNRLVVVSVDHRLIRSGPYRLVRHPAYVGGLLTFLGIGLVFGNPLSISAAVLVPLAAYSQRIRVEEQMLVHRFGDDYANYIRHVGRLTPRLGVTGK